MQNRKALKILATLTWAAGGLAAGLSILCGNAGVIERNTQWASNDFPLQVCFDLDRQQLQDFDPAKRHSIETFITSEFTPARTGIWFKFSDQCEDRRNAIHIKFVHDRGYFGRADSIGDHVIYPSNLTKFGQAIGMHPERHSENNRPISVDINENLLSEKVRELSGAILHELGHVVGLRHEHIRPASRYDAYAIYNPIRFHHEPEDQYETTTAFTEYDPNSIMNYGFVNFAMRTTRYKFNSTIKLVKDDPSLFSYFEKSNEGHPIYQIRIGLSVKDIHTLQCFYGVQNYCPIHTL